MGSLLRVAGQACAASPLEGALAAFMLGTPESATDKSQHWLEEGWNTACFMSTIRHARSIRADFREGDEDSNFSVFRVRRFSEWPEPLH